jgi:DUF1009 family protein
VHSLSVQISGKAQHIVPLKNISKGVPSTLKKYDNEDFPAIVIFADVLSSNGVKVIPLIEFMLKMGETSRVYSQV